MKGVNSKYRPESGTKCFISPEHADDEKGFLYGEYEILWSDGKFACYRKEGCWPVVSHWDHIIAKPLTESVRLIQPYPL